jgi:hypothetical protein
MYLLKLRDKIQWQETRNIQLQRLLLELIYAFYNIVRLFHNEWNELNKIKV